MTSLLLSLTLLNTSPVPSATPILQVLQLEQLSRVYVMLARMAPTAAARTENLLVSCHYLGSQGDGSGTGGLDWWQEPKDRGRRSGN